MKKYLLKIAHNAILNHFDNDVEVNRAKLLSKHEELNNAYATFVTLSINGKLRGCIGSLVAYQSLLEDVIHNAQAAAFHDPRFAPLSKEEFKQTSIEISILSTPKKVKYKNIADLKSKIRVKEDGVILEYESHRSTFLPQVWDELSTFETFFEHLCLKAGLDTNCLLNNPTIQTYQVEKIV